MALFQSSREKKLWALTALVLVVIYSTLSVAPDLSSFLRDKGLLTPLFVSVFFMIAISSVLIGLSRGPRLTEVALWLGIIAVILMVFQRIELVEERSHLMEYGVVALLINEALKERGEYRFPGLLAVILTSIFGLLDEVIQYFIPNRIFSWEDVQVNAMAAILAVGVSSILSWIRKRFRHT